LSNNFRLMLGDRNDSHLVSYLIVSFNEL